MLVCTYVCSHQANNATTEGKMADMDNAFQSGDSGSGGGYGRRHSGIGRGRKPSLATPETSDNRKGKEGRWGGEAPSLTLSSMSGLQYGPCVRMSFECFCVSPDASFPSAVVLSCSLLLKCCVLDLCVRVN